MGAVVGLVLASSAATHWVVVIHAIVLSDGAGKVATAQHPT